MSSFLQLSARWIGDKAIRGPGKLIENACEMKYYQDNFVFRREGGQKAYNTAKNFPFLIEKAAL